MSFLSNRINWRNKGDLIIENIEGNIFLNKSTLSK